MGGSIECGRGIELFENHRKRYSFSMYQSKWVVAHTSERGCPIYDDVSGQLWYLQIGIECNIFIIDEIYMTSATSVTLRFWFIFVRAWHPKTQKCISQKSFLLIIFLTQQRAHHRCFLLIIFTYETAQTPYMCSKLVSDSVTGQNWILWLIRLSLWKALVQI